MLNRMADSFHWIGRYIERADNNARLIDTIYYAHHMFSDKEDNLKDLQNRFLTRFCDVPITNEEKENLQTSTILDLITFDSTYENSILTCVSNVRRNVRIVREQIPSKLWDIINCFYLWMLENKGQKVEDLSPYSLYEQVQQKVALFYGMADSSMLNEQGWNFIQAGKFLERIGNVIHVMKTYCEFLLENEKIMENQFEYSQLITLLQSVDGYEAFRKCHADRVNLKEILEFLLFNSAFPRSISFSFIQLERYLKAIQNEFRIESTSKVIRQMITMKANLLNFKNLEAKMINQLLPLLNDLFHSCNLLGIEMEKCFFHEKGEEYSESTPHRKVAML